MKMDKLDDNDHTSPKTNLDDTRLQSKSSDQNEVKDGADELRSGIQALNTEAKIQDYKEDGIIDRKACDENGNINDDAKQDDIMFQENEDISLDSNKIQVYENEIQGDCSKMESNTYSKDEDARRAYNGLLPDVDDLDGDIQDIDTNKVDGNVAEASDNKREASVNDPNDEYGSEQEDGFLKNLISCTGKSKLLDEDNERFGFPPSEQESKPKLGFKEKISDKLRKTGEEIKSKFKSHPSDSNAHSKTVRPLSYQKAAERPTTHTPVSHEGSNIPGDPKASVQVQHSLLKETGDTNIQYKSDPKYIQRAQRIPSVSDFDQYDFTYPERGYMVLIVNDRFTRQAERDGAYWDLLKMKEIARKFGFRLFNCNGDRNLNKRQTLALLRKAQQADHSSCDSFMFMISTHGLEQRNPKAKGKPDHALVCADDELIFTSTILDMFNDENCPTLKNKPKLFFIQACRGEELDHGSDVFVLFPKHSVDKTCGVSNELSTNPTGTRSKRPMVDEYDTRPGLDSWAQNRAAGTVSAIGGTAGTVSAIGGTAGTVSAIGGLPSTQRNTAQQYNQASPTLEQTTMQSVEQVLNQHQLTPKYQSIRRPTSAPSHLVHTIYAPTPYAIVDTPSLRCDNDMLVMYAIPPGMFAWRNTSDGSWMITYLHEVLMNYDMRQRKDVLNLLAKVSFKMSERSTNTPSNKQIHMKKAITVIEHKLTKDVIFQPKAQLSDWIKTGNTRAY